MKLTCKRVKKPPESQYQIQNFQAIPDFHICPFDYITNPPYCYLKDNILYIRNYSFINGHWFKKGDIIDSETQQKLFEGLQECYNRFKKEVKKERKKNKKLQGYIETFIL